MSSGWKLFETSGHFDFTLTFHNLHCFDTRARVLSISFVATGVILLLVYAVQRKSDALRTCSLIPCGTSGLRQQFGSFRNRVQTFKE